MIESQNPCSLTSIKGEHENDAAITYIYGYSWQ